MKLTLLADDFMLITLTEPIMIQTWQFSTHVVNLL